MDERASGESGGNISVLDRMERKAGEVASRLRSVSLGAADETESDAVLHNGRMGQGADAPASVVEQRGTQAIVQDGSECMTESRTSSSVAEPIEDTQTDGHELDAFMGKAFEEKPIWRDLYDNLRDAFFPKKLPPLELTSQPIPVVDPMATKANPWSVGTSTVVNGAIIALLIYFGAKKIIPAVTPPQVITPVDISDFKIKAPKMAVTAGGGGGGGTHDIIDPSKGHLPKIDPHPITPPMIPKVQPKLAIDPAINVQKDIKLPDNNLPTIGVTNSSNVKLASNGQGSGGGMGSGSGGGLGSGNGNGFGPGSGGNTGGGVYRIGGGVTAPVALNEPEAEFSDEARRAKYQGEVMVTIIVDAQGNPQNARVVRPIGMGLDEKAVEAAMKYKFKPAMKEGHPVPVYLTIAINFRLY